MDSLEDVITDKRRVDGYQEGTHYVFFNCKKTGTTGKKTIKKTLFLTYEGILRLLFISKNNKTTKFISWATQTLFTVQMGTKEQKQRLFDKVMGADIDSVKNSLKCQPTKVSSIYFITLGKVKDLRESLNIGSTYSDDQIVVKYGRTDDLHRRLTEHQSKTFEGIKNVNLMVKYYSYVDNQFVSKAETSIKNFLEWGNHIFNHEKFNELAIINETQFDKIKEEFDKIQQLYSGTAAEYIYQIKSLESEYQHTIEIMKRDHTIEVITLKKDNEILELKLLLAQK
jgi:predicted GIY-YIG superfamily endonuclease